MNPQTEPVRKAKAYPPTIFLADDDDELRELVAIGLKADGFEVLEARDGGQMLECIRGALLHRTPMPDMVIMDVRMPECSGLALLAALHRARWPTPVILITGFGDAGLHERAKDLGATAVFDKPFDLDELRKTVKALYRPR
jgi:DNA-binding response OmpR family regulator